MCVSYYRHKKGLVRSPVSTTVPQISSTLYMVWGILYSFPEVQTHPLISSLIISWCIAEIVRYAFYGTKEAFGSAPYLLLWLRFDLHALAIQLDILFFPYYLILFMCY
ncbi:putative very-long-chain (3R)-3-hydroxyacyl-CoA dehydratase [Helianthus anomalus]